MKYDEKRSGVDDVAPFTTTISGKRLYLLDPQVEQISITDIVHHTSNLCRFTGGVTHFYSVAQHSVMVGQLVKTALDEAGDDHWSAEYWDQILAGLLHDAAETYTNDLSSPMKTAIRGKYKWIESAILRRIFEKYEIDWAYMNMAVKSADNIALLIERYYLVPENDSWPKVPASEMKYKRPDIISPEQGRKLFTDALRQALALRNKYRKEFPPEPEPTSVSA